jgi:hypothetical protein
MVHQMKITGLLVALVLVLGVAPARADFSADLQGLAGQGATITATLDLFSFAEQDCADLGAVGADLAALVAQAEAITAGLPTSLSLTVADLDNLDSLSEQVRQMAATTGRLALEINDINAVAELFEYRAALGALLALSDDIGAMADRIGEMADRILVMADNIGVMADRIILTQQLQSANLALTQASLLTTQQNMVLLSASLSSIIYNVSLGLVVDDADSLLDEMTVVSLTTENMAQELEGLQAATALLRSGVLDLAAWLNSSSQGASHYINGDTLTAFGDLSGLYAGLAYALESYAATINQVAPLTDTVVLADATAAMLRLTADIGVMAGRIMEMADRIIVMADNIGLMADTIVLTQQLQQANMELTESSLLTAQNLTVATIKNMGL